MRLIYDANCVPSWYMYLIGLYLLIVIIVVALIIKDKKEPIKALAWIIFIISIPLIGLLLYRLVGRNFRKEKIFNRKEIKDLEYLRILSNQQFKKIKESTLVDYKSLRRHKAMIMLMLKNSKSLFTQNNKVTVLIDGKDTFASLIEALQKAKETIHFEYYIFENDKIGSKIADVLMQKAEQGVEVRFIYDDVGSWNLSSAFVRKMRKAGVQVKCFMPVVFPWLTSKVNYRNHRKIVVIDGRIAFTGGLNIADRYLTHGRVKKWRDTHLRIEGEGALMLQAIFITDWYFLNKKELLTQLKYFPNQTKFEPKVALQVVSSGPDSDWASIMQGFFFAITSAKEHIYISSPYFMPNQAVLTALKVAALSGLDVRILLPSRSDSKIVYWASRSYIGELLEAGIKVHLFMAGFNHSKTIMIDGEFCSVGSANMDIRSFEDNFEISVLIYDAKITGQLEGAFRNDLSQSKLVDIEWWKKRSKIHAVYESLSRLLSPLL